MKQNKLLSVVAVVFALAITACGNKQDDAKHKHEWGSYVETKAATCTEDGVKERECKTCHEKQTQKITALGHDWEDKEVVTEPGCESEGVQNVECKRCHVKDTKKIDPAGHKFAAEADDVWTTVLDPTCTQPGSRTHKCTVCQKDIAEEIPATGHKYAKVKDENGEDTDEDVVEWTTKPTCLAGGEGKKVCLVCGDELAVTSEKLDHEFVPGDDSVPAAGETVFHEFTCKNGCGQKYLGFKANEVTADSKEHLVIGTDGGARFWGRPIGNACELDAEGTASASTEPVFDDSVEGDFFEYVFTLDDATAEILSTCRCYADAKPAAYLAGQDFWACDPNAEEWTPGYYIDDDPSTPDVNEKGTPISNYRYILYVDDVVQPFDPEILAPVGGSATREPRMEYEMPYTFNFTPGQHKISLRMAGGYRSTFYNFFFKPYTETPAQPAA